MAHTKIKFVTDCVCDIPQDLVDQWEIGVVPCFVNYGGESYADDGVELDRVAFFEQMTSMPDVPTTAAPPPALAEEFIDVAFEESDHVIILTTPANLSAIYNSMRIASEKLPQDRVTLIDSGQLTMALGWQVVVGAETAAKTGDIQQTIDAITSVRNNQALYAGLATIEMLRRSGRVGWAAGSIGSLLQIKPVVSVQDGVVSQAARVRTFRRVSGKLIELVKQHAPLDKLAILHTNNLEGAEQLKEDLKDILPEQTIITLAGPTIGTHIGPGALALAPVSKSWRA